MTILEERQQISRVVNAIEVCWRCQRVSECCKHLLGNLVLLLLCLPCRMEIERGK